MKIKSRNQARHTPESDNPGFSSGMSNPTDPTSQRVDTQPSAETARQEMETAKWLQEHQGSLELRAGFLPASRRRLEGRIQREARRSLSDSLWARPQFRLAVNTAALAVVLAALILFNSTMLAAARLALPGELLYPVKRASEQMQIWMAFDEARRADLYVAFARERSNELQALMLENEYANLEVASIRVLQEVDLANQHLARSQNLDPGQNLQLTQELTSTMETQVLVLQALRPSVPAESQAMVNYLIATAH